MLQILGYTAMPSTVYPSVLSKYLLNVYKHIFIWYKNQQFYLTIIFIE